ncbi:MULTISPECIES: 16S rRNA (guanine(966)-N(2))-methyltransferase RsmD [Metabacillus]|jgi:16S rRNA (guanine966-N2)-methyltransferase|uniref:16S rRNA (Guanine(966)-N(2))-methyltransferase RsmD n=1 Tax=Metabacillus rhizolycopersici TaxID=2875709 RepID=A0ABS7ULA4_9BACI|nr:MULTISPECIES: 16S rRNA (guanine(966)-N(2))-methyltransferase RsmD [Metabacillus]MBZ5748728.1 16S rRNA (guanine(966)-N(2))-methyltransferase RsmD [Metabacillus rhizolycopersici]MCM3652766.1 16S rRNA (guanine(966)-N(2))-methyltransferase RsmD [Metabacillus litoralis]
MRVVSGNYKGRSLKAVPGVSTRPTTDKVKEAIFNMVGPYFEGGVALDLFAGSGGLGIEALSRGIERCIFVDRESKAIQTIHKNLEVCHAIEASEVYRNDAERALKAIIKRELQFQLIFLDPPYKQQKLKTLINEISENRLLRKDGFIVTEHGSDIQLPEEIDQLIQLKHETYGMSSITIYRYSHKGEE